MPGEYRSAAGKAQVAVKEGTKVASSNFDISTAGTTLTVKETCPGAAEFSYGYTVTATELKEIYAGGSKTEVATYAKL